MKLAHYSDPAKFLAEAKHFLEACEAENNLILGVTLALATHPERTEHTPYFATVEEGGRIKAAGMITPPYGIVLTRAEAQFLEEIADDLYKRELVVPGVNGPKDTSLAFAQRWTSIKACKYQMHRSLRIYQLSHVIPPKPVSGRMRAPFSTEKDTVTDWARKLGSELGETNIQQEAAEIVERLTKEERLFVWDDEGLRSMAGSSGPTTHGARINLVYTPPEFRGKGYASACVAAVSQAMLNSGREFCYLFTDLSNPVSNHVYKRIGYVPVCDFDEYRFTYADTEFLHRTK